MAGNAIYIQEITAFLQKREETPVGSALPLSGCAMFTGVNWPGSAAVRKHGGQKQERIERFNELEQEVKNISASGELEMSSAGDRLGKNCGRVRASGT